MSSNGLFETEESDIVKLLPDACTHQRTGWINVGVHSVKLHLNDNGDLIIQAYARSNENDELSEVTVTKESAVAAGGVDYDE